MARCSLTFPTPSYMFIHKHPNPLTSKFAIAFSWACWYKNLLTHNLFYKLVEVQVIRGQEQCFVSFCWQESVPRLPVQPVSLLDSWARHNFFHKLENRSANILHFLLCSTVHVEVHMGSYLHVFCKTTTFAASCPVSVRCYGGKQKG
jgi:hypothetical protein